MKKLLPYIFGLFALVAVAITWITCFSAFFADGEGWLWQGGLWIIPVLLQLGALWFLYIAYRAHRSGSHPIDGMGRILFDQDAGIMPIYKIGQFWFFVGLQLGALGVLIWQYMER